MIENAFKKKSVLSMTKNPSKEINIPRCYRYLWNSQTTAENWNYLLNRTFSSGTVTYKQPQP